MIRFIPIIILLFFGCKKPSERSCWKSASNPAFETRELPNLSVLNIFDDVNVILKQDNLNFIKVESYANLISFITTTNTDTAIEIMNLNKCNSLRKSSIENTVIIHYDSLSQVNLYGSGEITFEDTIHQQYFDITSYNSRSKLNISISCQSLYCAFIEGSVVATINGLSDSTYIFQSQYSIVNASNLVNSYLHFSNNSTGDAYVQATNKLAVELLDVGNIYYSGTPNLKILADIGLGDVIAQ